MCILSLLLLLDVAVLSDDGNVDLTVSTVFVPFPCCHRYCCHGGPRCGPLLKLLLVHVMILAALALQHWVLGLILPLCCSCCLCRCSCWCAAVHDPKHITRAPATSQQPYSPPSRAEHALFPFHSARIFTAACLPEDQEHVQALAFGFAVQAC